MRHADNALGSVDPVVMMSTARFRLTTAFYAVSLFAASIASFGVLVGTILAACVLFFWLVVYPSPTPGLTVSRLALYIFVPALLVLLLLPAKSGVSESGRRNGCINFVRQLTVAILVYEMEHGSLPPAFVADETGKPMHSWRVLILPYIEHDDLYGRYDFDEPWDSPANLKLLKECPDIYKCPSRHLPIGHTCYAAVVGPETVWTGERGTRLEEIVDGPDKTIALVESPTLIPWTQPSDLSIDEFMNSLASGDRNSFGHYIDHPFKHGHAVSAARVDGSTLGIYKGMKAESIRAMLTSAGGEDLTEDDFTPVVTTRWGLIISLSLLAILAVLPAVKLIRRRVS